MVTLLITKFRKGLLRSVSDFFKSVNIWQSYKQERDCLVRCLVITIGTTGGPTARSMAGPQRQAAAAVPWMVVRRRLKS